MGIADGPVVRVDAGHPVGELVQVRLADDDASLIAKSSDDWRILGSRLVREDHAAPGRHHSRDVDEVFDSDDGALAFL